MLNLSHKAKRNQLTKTSCILNTDGGLVVQRNYTYDKIASSRFLLQEQRDAYGRGTEYILKRNGNRQCAATVAYGTLGRIALAGFIHAGVEHQFRYGYLAGSNLLQSLAMPNGVTLTQSYEEKRDLLTGMDYVRDNSLITQRQYSYDALGRPMTRDTRYPNKAIHHADTFAYNKRSELTGALLDENAYTYAYDNIGNRITAQENTAQVTYTTNDLNQYTQIDTNGNDFTPEYDADGNQTLIQTTTGIWHVTYNAQNRAIRFENESNGTVITCDYDYMGRRIWKKVENANGTVSLHQRYIYYDYLQIAALDLTRATLNGLWLLTWDPSQAVATRPLAIRKDGSFLTYGWDLTKNICERRTRAIRGSFPNATPTVPSARSQWRGIRFNPLQWSSEVYDAELGLAYYNYRYCNPRDGRWIRKDPIGEDESLDLYQALFNSPLLYLDILGLAQIITDMTNGYTYWIPTNCCCESPQKFKSLNQVVKSAKPGANDPYESEDTRVGHTEVTKKDPVAYGPNIPILTNDPRGRWLHGGGTRLGSKGSQEPYQELCPTFGCTRLHNEDVKTLGNLRKEHEKKYPKEKVPYKRDHFEKGSVLSAYTQCLEEYNSEPCQQKQNKR